MANAGSCRQSSWWVGNSFAPIAAASLEHSDVKQRKFQSACDALGSLEAETVGNIVHDDPAAGHRSMFLQLREDGFHPIGRDGKAGDDGAAGRRIVCRPPSSRDVEFDASGGVVSRLISSRLLGILWSGA